MQFKNFSIKALIYELLHPIRNIKKYKKFEFIQNYYIGPGRTHEPHLTIFCTFIKLLERESGKNF